MIRLPFFASYAARHKVSVSGLIDHIIVRGWVSGMWLHGVFFYDLCP